MTPEERQEIRERLAAVEERVPKNWTLFQSAGQPYVDIARLLADYDHLVEVARDAVTLVAWLCDEADAREAIPYYTGIARKSLPRLRALIDPATPDASEGEPK